MRNEGGGFAEILRLRSQLFWHSLSLIRRFSPLRMTKWGDSRSLKLAVFSYRKPNPQLLISSHQSLSLPLPSPSLML